VLKIDLTALNEFREKVLRDGYAWDYDADMPVHRVVALRAVGTLEGCEVHHINHVKKDNTPNNLIVLTPMGHRMVHYMEFDNDAYVQYGTLRRPDNLIRLLDDARLWHIYVGTAIRSARPRPMVSSRQTKPKEHNDNA